MKLSVLPPNTWLYQLAMALYFISYLSNNILVLRFVLASASVCLFLWSIFDLRASVDTCVWNGVFFFINLAHGCYILWQQRDVKFKNDEYEEIYKKMFIPPLSPMSRADFALLSSLAFIRDLKAGSSYADHGNKIHSLSLLISGKIAVTNLQLEIPTDMTSKKEMVINHIHPYQFIDSPQWVTRHSIKDQVFIVTLKAEEDSRFIMWPMEVLEELFLKQPQFRTYLECLAGSDVAHKMLAMDLASRIAEQHSVKLKTNSITGGNNGNTNKFSNSDNNANSSSTTRSEVLGEGDNMV